MKSKILIIVLVLIALVLGIMIYQGTTISTPQGPIREGLDQVRPLASLQPILPALPKENASDEQKKSFATEVTNRAEEKDSMEIGKLCTLSPQIVKVVESSTFTFKNVDVADHNISITENINIPAKSEKSIVVKFERGPGIYIIACDGKPAGYIIIHQV